MLNVLVDIIIHNKYKLSTGLFHVNPGHISNFSFTFAGVYDHDEKKIYGSYE